MVDTANPVEWDPAMAAIHIHNTPIKLTGESRVQPEVVVEQAEAARRCLVRVDYSCVCGTCAEDRERVGLMSGETEVEPRPSNFGGPVIQGLYVSELSGRFGIDSPLTGKERLAAIDVAFSESGRVKSGGHVNCAANADFDKVVGNILNLKAEIETYASVQLGDKYDQSAMDEVYYWADNASISRRYADWDQSALVEVLGDGAGNGIEIVADVNHDAETLIRTNIKNGTVGQTEIYALTGKRSFVQDDAYSEVIENVLATGTDPNRMKRVMEHAREAVIVSVSQLLPNPELHQISISA